MTYLLDGLIAPSQVRMAVEKPRTGFRQNDSGMLGILRFLTHAIEGLTELNLVNGKLSYLDACVCIGLCLRNYTCCRSDQHETASYWGCEIHNGSHYDVLAADGQLGVSEGLGNLEEINGLKYYMLRQISRIGGDLSDFGGQW